MSLENIVILDTETTGLDYTKDKVIEIAAVLYHVPTRHVMAQVSCLLEADGNAAEHINKISPDALKCVNKHVVFQSFLLLSQMITRADYIVAHNAQFDKKWVGQIHNLFSLAENSKWICTKNDVTWPFKKGTSLSLSNICAELGVPIANAHRAIDDCHLLRMAIETQPDITAFLLNHNDAR